MTQWPSPRPREALTVSVANIYTFPYPRTYSRQRKHLIGYKALQFMCGQTVNILIITPNYTPVITNQYMPM